MTFRSFSTWCAGVLVAPLLSACASTGEAAPPRVVQPLPPASPPPEKTTESVGFEGNLAGRLVVATGRGAEFESRTRHRGELVERIRRLRAERAQLLEEEADEDEDAPEASAKALAARAADARERRQRLSYLFYEILMRQSELQGIEQSSVLAVVARIVETAQKHASVLVVIPSVEEGERLRKNCSEGGFCGLFERQDGRAAPPIAYLPHEGPWIRDYGPDVVTITRGQRVAYDMLDPIYFGKRANAKSLTERARMNQQREDLANQALFGEADVGDALPKLDLLRHRTEALTDPLLLSRPVDDNFNRELGLSAHWIGARSVRAMSLEIEGGNLSRMPDGTCLTTTEAALSFMSSEPTAGDTFPRSLEGFERALAAEELCSRTITLLPLPGDRVIPHVDMFALPSPKARRVLLADFEVGSDEDHDLHALRIEAKLRMDRNERLLRDAGIDVVRVRALGPRRDDSVWYPTNLNATLLMGRDGRRVALVPTYERADGEESIQVAASIQAQAVEKIRAELGSNGIVETVEAREAALAQGAVHCLTRVFPAGSLAEAEQPTASAGE